MVNFKHLDASVSGDFNFIESAQAVLQTVLKQTVKGQVEPKDTARWQNVTGWGRYTGR